MNKSYFAKEVAALLTIVLIMPLAVIFVPKGVHGQAAFETNPAVLIPLGTMVTPTVSSAAANKATAVESALTTIEATLTAVATAATQVAMYAEWVNTYILQPIAFIKSALLMKGMTAGVIAFVNGGSNGTGQSQFVRNLQGMNQSIGDTQANAFFVQFGKNSNSPFSRSINSSLRANYLQQTSLAGFFAGNRNTLPQYSRNQNAYLAGNWSQGGAGAWFALTTQGQNNPYILHQRAQVEMYYMVQEKTAARLQELTWGGGMLSWCGGDAAKNAGELAPGTEGSSQQGPPDPSQLPPGTEGSTQQGPPAPASTKKAAAPGDPCTNSDGSPGTIQTPGGVISASLNKVLGGGQDKLNAIGNAGSQLGKIIGSIGTVMGTINIANDVLIGPDNGGLASSGRSPAFTGAAIDRQGRVTGSAIDIEGGVYQNAAESAVVANAVGKISERIDKYETAWNTIRNVANTASTKLAELITACPALEGAAQTALSTAVVPVLAKATEAATAIADARTAQQAATTGGASAAADNAHRLQSMRPTEGDAVEAEQQARTTDMAKAVPEGSLGISMGSVVDRMNLISANVDAIKTSCTIPLPPTTQ